MSRERRASKDPKGATKASVSPSKSAPSVRTTRARVERAEIEASAERPRKAERTEARAEPDSAAPKMKPTPLTPRRIPTRRTDREDPSAPIEKGTLVRSLDGAFEGKSGVVQELDGRGGARVMFGLLTTRVEVKDLVALSPDRGRPVLGSSHRKPQPQS